MVSKSLAAVTTSSRPPAAPCPVAQPSHSPVVVRVSNHVAVWHIVTAVHARRTFRRGRVLRVLLVSVPPAAQPHNTTLNGGRAGNVPSFNRLSVHASSPLLAASGPPVSSALCFTGPVYLGPHPFGTTKPSQLRPLLWRHPQGDCYRFLPLLHWLAALTPSGATSVTRLHRCRCLR